MPREQCSTDHSWPSNNPPIPALASARQASGRENTRRRRVKTWTICKSGSPLIPAVSRCWTDGLQRWWSNSVRLWACVAKTEKQQGAKQGGRRQGGAAEHTRHSTTRTTDTIPTACRTRMRGTSASQQPPRSDCRRCQRESSEPENHVMVIAAAPWEREPSPAAAREQQRQRSPGLHHAPPAMSRLMRHGTPSPVFADHVAPSSRR